MNLIICGGNEAKKQAQAHQKWQKRLLRLRNPTPDAATAESSRPLASRTNERDLSAQLFTFKDAFGDRELVSAHCDNGCPHVTLNLSKVRWKSVPMHLDGLVHAFRSNGPTKSFMCLAIVAPSGRRVFIAFSKEIYVSQRFPAKRRMQLRLQETATHIYSV